ncbi:MAG: HAD family hydrolase, partial [candidate division Zixibacteria bacterium]|nr:HAD family hydrolase [candidate division Zixibacteria bacterium]
SQSIPTAIGTTKTRKHTALIVEKMGWSELLEAFACGDEAKQKPEPDIFNLALDRIGVDASEALVVGDTVNDVLAARSAGIRVVTIESPFGDKSALLTAPPDAHFQNLSEFYMAIFEVESFDPRVVCKGG